MTMSRRLIVGMRNRLIHGYDEVDVDEVWNASVKDVPDLVERLLPLSPSLREDGE